MNCSYQSPYGKITSNWKTEDLMKITSLNLKYLKFEKLDVAYICQLKTLTELDFVRSTIGTQELSQLKFLPRLSKLNLGKVDLKDEGLAFVKDIKTLTVLNLHNTEITDTGLAHLKSMSSLKEIELTHCSKLSAAGIADLRAALPNCKINAPTGVTPEE